MLGLTAHVEGFLRRHESAYNCRPSQVQCSLSSVVQLHAREVLGSALLSFSSAPDCFSTIVMQQSSLYPDEVKTGLLGHSVNANTLLKW